MAFCPQCGKRLADRATTCLACGHEVHRAPAGRGGRFKGTMLMGAAAVPEATAAEPGPPPAGRGGHARPEEGARPAPRDAPQPASGRRGLNATMLGGIRAPAASPDRPGLDSPPVAASARLPAAQSPEAARGASEAPVGHAPHSAPGPWTGSGRESGPPPGGIAPYAAAHRTYLTDSPLAGPAAMAETREGHYGPAPHPPGAGRQANQRDDTAQRLVLRNSPGAGSAPEPLQRRAPSAGWQHEQAPSGGFIWLLIGFVGMLAIAGLGVLAAKMMGLL